MSSAGPKPEGPFVCAAVDLGAGSGRVMLGVVDASQVALHEVHRFHYPPRISKGHLRWDFETIWADILQGLDAAFAYGRAQGLPPIRSVGVDSWGVDYGLLDATGALLEDPICYRDERTRGGPEAFFAKVDRAEVFRRTGIQFLDFNTLYQLDAHTRSGFPPAAARLLMLPDLIHHRLCGRAVTEQSNASTTQLFDGQHWDPVLAAAAGVPMQWLPEVVPAGTVLGPLLPALAQRWSSSAVVVAPATHDTGSAVAGAPLAPGWAYVSSGTWSLVGVERKVSNRAPAALAHGFTNELGAGGTVRFLKNVMGLWLLERCRSQWMSEGHAVDFATLLAQSTHVSRHRVVFPDDSRFLNPPSMVDALNVQLSETAQSPTRDPATLCRIILDSLALRYASLVDVMEMIEGVRARGLQIIGGGSRNDLLNQAAASATRLPVHAGPVEATALGNVAVQAIAAGCFADLASARSAVEASFPTRAFVPQPGGIDSDLRARYGQIEARFVSRSR